MQQNTMPAPPGIPYASLRGVNPQEIDIRGLFMIIFRRRLVILAFMLVGLLLAMAVLTVVKPHYTAHSLLLIEPGMLQQNAEDFAAPGNKVRIDTSQVLSELEVLRSRSMARKVIERLSLMTDPEFNPRFREIAAQDQSQDTQFRKLSVYGSELQNLPPEAAARAIAAAETLFLDRLRVRSISGSFALQIEFTSINAHKAALIANTLADLYAEQSLESKHLSSRKLSGWLDQRLNDLRKQVQIAEASVENYRATHNLAEGKGAVMSAEQLTQMNSQLVLAQAQQAEAQARVEQILALAESPEKIEQAAAALDSPMVHELKLQTVKLEGELSELSSRYGEKHPVIIKLKAELADLRGTLRAEILKIKDAAESDLNYATARVQALQEGLGQVSGQRNVDNEAMITLRALEREAEAARQIFDTFLETYKKTDRQEELQESQARVISYAAIPERPSYPNTGLVLSLAMIAALFSGLIFALILEKLDNTYRSAGQLESALGFPCHALVPQVAGLSGPEVAAYILDKPASTVAESVRTMRMAVNLRASQAQRPKVITITSSFPGEGKTTLSLWLARLAAKSGEKVIIIDADLRRPNVHKSLGRENDASLAEYLNGKKKFEEVVRKDDMSGLHMIFGRSLPGHALDLVGSKRMEKLVKSLREVYDLVIIDSAAALAVSDARILATLSDQLLYVVSWDQTPREVVHSGVKQFADMNYTSLGFVLTNVDVERHALYGYGDTAHYYGRYKEYYIN